MTCNYWVLLYEDGPGVLSSSAKKLDFLYCISFLFFSTLFSHSFLLSFSVFLFSFLLSSSSCLLFFLSHVSSVHLRIP